MDIYLPIAEMSADLFLLLGLGGAVGFLSGDVRRRRRLPADAAPDPHRHSAAGRGRHAGAADPRPPRSRACWPTCGAAMSTCAWGSCWSPAACVGSVLGVWLFGLLRRLGQIDLSIALAYVLLLGIVGALMLVESVRAWLRVRDAARQPRASGTGISGCTACRSSCASAARASTSARWCRSASASWPASSSPSWASAAASSWCRR